MNRTLVAMLSVVALGAAACGGDTNERAGAPDACPLESLDHGDAVDLSVMWAGGFNPSSTTARIAEFDAKQDGITVDVENTGGFFEPALRFLDDDPPVIGEVGYSILPALAEAGAIRPVGPCLESAGVDFDTMLPAAVAKGQYDGKTYGASSNIDVELLLYDRAAFDRAGLDPDVAPRTFDELLTDGRALRDKLGLEHPVAWPFPQIALVGLDIASPDARAAAEAWLQLAKEDLLYGPIDGDPPPIGTGNAAIQLVEPHGLWGYASAIDAGQSPDADLGVAPLPSVQAPVSPIGGGVWVVSASATDAEVAAAARFLAWYGQPEQEAFFHINTDMYPSSTLGAANATTATYWQEHTLLGEGWTALTERPIELKGWEVVLGSFATLIPRLLEVVDGGATFDHQWETIVATMAKLEAAQKADPERLLRCLFAHIEDKDSAVDMCADPSGH